MGRPKKNSTEAPDSLPVDENKQADELTAAIPNSMEPLTIKTEVVLEYMEKQFPQVHSTLPSEKDISVNKFVRDSNGLLKSVQYHFTENGSIDWKKMVDKKHLVPNRDRFKNQPDLDLKSLDVETLADNQLLILISGIKEVAQIRGFYSVDYDVIEARPDFVAVKCTIQWIPNYETDGKIVQFSALADACVENTHDFAKFFLSTIAENRAFVRAVRNYLRINILGSDEIGGKDKVPQEESPSESDSPTHSPTALLKKTLDEANISFEKMKETSVLKGYEGADSWICIDDVPKLTVFQIISAIKAKQKK